MKVQVESPYIEIEGIKHPVTETTARLCSLLLKSEGRVVPYDNLYARLGFESNRTSNNMLSVYTYRIRCILEPYGYKVASVHGEGYVLYKNEHRKAA